MHSYRSSSLGSGLIALALTTTVVACGGSANHGTGNGTGGTGGTGGTATGSTTATATGGGTGSGTTTTHPDAGSTGTTSGTATNTGSPSTTYPAFPVDVAQVGDNGGPVLSNPVIVTITWSTDPDAATYNALGDSIGASPYWRAINSEYGVGAATSGTANHVSITTAPPTGGFNDQDLDSWVESSVGTLFPANTSNTIYTVYLPPNSKLLFGGPSGQDACQSGVGGYHDETSKKGYVYAIMPHCQGFQTADVELSATHELNEAVTDPHPSSNNAYSGFDQNHLAMEFFNQFQDELGDACEMFLTATDTTDFTPYTVQRQWSNKSAAAGSQWCVPKLPEPFYNTTFLAADSLDNISVNLSTLFQGAPAVTSKGLKMALNTTRTIPLGLFSDMATSAPFTLDIQGLDQPIAQDQNGNNINNGTATVTLDKTSGVNGEITNLTVTPTAYSSLGIIFFYVRAQLPGAQAHHYLPILISQN